MIVQSEEASTWSEALSGSGRAFALIFDRHYDRVFRHVVGLVEQPADADEITAAAFLDLWRTRVRVRVVNGSVLPWLLVTAGNHARNHRRGVQRYRDLLGRLPRDDDTIDAAVIVAGADEEDRRARAVARALRTLKPVDAQLIALTTQGELPVHVAAAALGLTAGTARVRLHRAHARLRDRLAPELFPSTPEEPSS